MTTSDDTTNDKLAIAQSNVDELAIPVRFPRGVSWALGALVVVPLIGSVAAGIILWSCHTDAVIQGLATVAAALIGAGVVALGFVVQRHQQIREAVRSDTQAIAHEMLDAGSRGQIALSYLSQVILRQHPMTREERASG